MRRLYLHCGVHRTGTTLIQSYLAKNRAFFADKGVIYPFDEDNHQTIVNALKTRRLKSVELVERLNNVPARSGDALLLSGEDFCSIDDKDWIRPLAAAFDLRIIFYMRRQDIWLNSWYNQNIKWPFNKRDCGLSPHEFLASVSSYFWIDYKATLDRFVSAAGRDALLLGVVEAQQVSDIVPDFLEKIGLRDVAAPKVENVTRNESVSPLAVEILRHLNLLDLPIGARYLVVQTVAEIAERVEPGQSQMVFTPKERREILARFERSNEDVARLYFGRQDGRLFLEPQVADDDPFARVSLPSSDTLLRRIMAPLLKTHLTERPARSVLPASLANAPPIVVTRSAALNSSSKSSHFSANRVHPVIVASRDAQGVKWDAPNRILSFLWKLRPSASVVEMGCGNALWLRTAHKLGASNIRGYDIPEISLEDRKLTADQFEAADLSKPISLPQRYDLAISTEVAEHLPKEAATTFIRNLVTASDWVLFGAAVPYQGGMHHVNENWIEYWVEIFSKHDYVCYDIVRSAFWNDPCVPYYYRQNTLLLVKAGTDQPLKNHGFSPTLKPLSLIHPELYLKAMSQPPRDIDQVLLCLQSYMKSAYRSNA